jgi:RNA polymerase sigma factor (TIGR02999 family)
LRDGDKEAESKLMALVYDELHHIAERYMRRERSDHTLQPTALVNEAYMRMLTQRDREWNGRVHFFAVAAQAMRRILVDHARAHRSGKRGGARAKLELQDTLIAAQEQPDHLLALDAALNRLAEWDARQGKVVELRVFGGLSEDEIAQTLGVSVRTVKRDWSMAKAWLHGEIFGDSG